MYSSIAMWLAFATLWLQLVAGQRHPRWDDSDLERYVSRPDLRPPKFSVNVLDEKNIAPGYWFTAPYVDLINRKPTSIYQTNQVGPHIYDNYGQLVWSGADMFPARNVFDFKRSSHGSPTFLLGPHELEKDHIGGAGIIMNTSYTIRKYVHLPRGARTVNMHEFNVLDNGNTALMFMHEGRFYESSKPEYHGWIIDLGFVEVDIKSGKPLFEWWAADHVHPLDSTIDRPRSPGDARHSWDFFHINAVDKDSNGDYLVSARHMNTIYKISGKDGSIIWQLGGKHSSFQQLGFNFSSQHDARFRSQSETTTVISFLNNAADGRTFTADVSSAMVVALDTSKKPMTATLVRKYDRPDGRRTNLRGNVQILPNSNTFVSWSANSYLSEFTEDGDLVLEAHFMSDRFSTYRSYKFEFKGDPFLPPDLVCTAYGTSAATATTICYVSWNGATEVRSWRFHAANPDGTSAGLLGTASKEGFETLHMSNGYTPKVFVEALDVNGQVLRKSAAMKTKLPISHGFDMSLEAGGEDLPKQKHQSSHAKGNIHGFNDMFGDNLGEWPTVWPMIFCVMLGAVGALLITHSSKFLRTFMSRGVVQKGRIRVGDA